MYHYMTEEMIVCYKNMLIEEEKCVATIEKYVHDVYTFWKYVGKEQQVSKEMVIKYKENLVSKYAAVTVNGMLVSLNSFFKKMNWNDCVVRILKIQRDAFRPQERELTKEEYNRLIAAAESKGDIRLCLLMQTICSTGIRVSELQFITVESICTRRAKVSLKGKIRTVILPMALCRKLKKYILNNNIKRGSVFVTKTGKPLDRSNIFRAMKALYKLAEVEPGKIFPHNLRHLFACMYYQVEKDIVHLADILGHSSVNTTRIYLAKSAKEQETQIEHLGLVV